MRYNHLGRSGLQVSELCLGTMQFGWTCDEPTSHAIMDRFFEAGGTFVDSADVYTNWDPASHAGMAEEIIGRWSEFRRNRDKVILATKVGSRMHDGANGEGLSRSRVLASCEGSLRRLRTDYIDLYQTHRLDPNTPIDETMSAMDKLVRDGKVRYLGVSNYPAWRLMEALCCCDKRGYPRFETYQPEYSLIERRVFEYELMPLCRRYGLGVIPYSPLAGGFLTGKYRKGKPTPESVRKGQAAGYSNDEGWAVLDALEEIGRKYGKSITQTALAWLLSNPVITAPIIGANTVDQLNDSLGAADYRLTAEEYSRLDGLTKSQRNWRQVWE